MDPKDRAELDRLLDIAEREELLAAAPSPDQERVMAEQVLAEQRALADMHERQADAVRERRQVLAPDAEWIDE